MNFSHLEFNLGIAVKIRKNICLFVLFSTTFIAQNAIAVEGYKNLKFGISKGEVLGDGICTLQEYESDQPGVESYFCDDFSFGGKIVQAGAFFINDEFLRFVIVPPVDVAIGLAKGLSEKYGSPSSSSSQKEFQAIDTLPNREAFIAFDENTIFLKLMSNENYEQSALLIYTSKKYEILLLENQKQSINDDL